MKKLIEVCVEYLGLKKPYNIRLYSREHESGSASYTAWHNTEGRKQLLSHEIRVYLGNLKTDTRDIETLIAHEFVHAWQAEYKPRSAAHGRVFKNKASELMLELLDNNIYVPKIYLKGVDK